MSVYELPEGITCDGEEFFATCPECGRSQADMGESVGCEECGALMPTLNSSEWPSCPDCGRPILPDEVKRGIIRCATKCI